MYAKRAIGSPGYALMPRQFVEELRLAGEVFEGSDAKSLENTEA